MSRDLNSIKGIVDRYKPKVESRLGIKIEDITVKSIYDFYRVNQIKENFKGVAHPRKLLAYVLLVPLAYLLHRFEIGIMRVGMNTSEGVIRVDDVLLPTMSEGYIHSGVMHELAHRVQHKMNPALSELSNGEESSLTTILRTLPSILEESFRRDCIVEGFAEFMALDYLADLYDIDTGQYLIKSRTNHLEEANSRLASPSSLGYNFFRTIADGNKKEGKVDLEVLVNILKNPDIPIEQIRNPELFLKV